jgi:hypothetical protein
MKAALSLGNVDACISIYMYLHIDVHVVGGGTIISKVGRRFGPHMQV